MNITNLIPQKYPFQLIDGVIEFKPNEYLIAFKNITSGEWVYENRNLATHHYPETLMIESAAQLGVLFHKMNQEGKEGNQPKNFFYLRKLQSYRT